MTKNPGLDLASEGTRELIALTNKQFSYWNDALRRETNAEMPAGHMIDYWFILSALATQAPEYQMLKKDAFSLIPNLGEETGRKYVAAVEKLGFAETVKTRGNIYLRITEGGKRAVAATLGQWVKKFGEIQMKHFMQTT